MTWPLSDAFTGTDGTELSAYSASWVEHSSWATEAARIQGNRLAGDNTSATSVYYYNDAAPSADYEVSAVVYQVDTSTTRNAGVVGRVNPASSTFYMARYRRGTGVQLFKFVASTTAVQLGSTVAGDITVGATMTLALRFEGDAISVKKDGSTVISVTNSEITAAGYAGIWIAGTSTSGVHLDDWAAAELSVGGSSIPAIFNHYNRLRRA